MDQLTAAVGMGLIVSLLFSEVFGLAAGGMVVPGYIALSLGRPWDVLATLLVALCAWGLVRLAARVVIIYGRRRIVAMTLAGFVLGALFRATPLAAADATALGGDALHVIGYIIPGLIALWIDRQGLVSTFCALLTSSVVVRLALILLGMELIL